MNTDTNELVDLRLRASRDIHEELETGQLQEDLEALVDRRAERRLDALKTEGCVGLPAELEHAARCALRGQESVKVSRQSKGRLSKWAASQRGQNRRGK